MSSIDTLKIRTELGLNIQQFADLVSMDRRSVSNWESGRAKMPESKVKLIELLIDKARSNSAKPNEALEVINSKSVENLNREVLDLKDHIQTLKDMLDMVKRENVFLKEKLDNVGKESAG